MLRRLILCLSLLCLAALASANELLIRAQHASQELLSRSNNVSIPLEERLRLQLRGGAFDPAGADFRAFAAGHEQEAQWMQLQFQLDRYDFDGIPQLPVMRLRITDTPYSLALRMRWLFIQDDLAAVDRAAKDITPTSDPVRVAARAEFMLRTLHYDSALTYAGWAIRAARNPAERSTAQVTYAKALYKLNRYAECRDSLAALFDADHLDSDVLFQTAYVLIQLGETLEAMDLLEEAIRWNPWQEGAQYFLGNGYSRLNYTQIAESAKSGLSAAERLTREGSAAWADRNYDIAEAKFREALLRCPLYGRARNGLAKTLEGKRMLVNIHREADEQLFDDTPMPVVPMIEQYILNWSALSPRHRKQVALAVEPWQRYVPLLVECGEHHYIKPLHEKLSDCPNMKSMKDQRISYDTRLWDDVRGCGGFTTVTGIEDVERSIYFSYNTVLHELTHQVHGLFPSADLRRLDEQWDATRKRDDAGTPTFMSRYQSASVWEYFAEGANALYSPRRNAYDTREIVRERLVVMDTALVSLVQYYVNAPNLDACWPVGLINACQDAIEHAELERAQSLVDRAAAREPRAEVVLAAQSHLRSLRDDDGGALAYADSLARYFPDKARSYSQIEAALFMGTPNCDSACAEVVKRGLEAVDSTERKELMLNYGDVLMRAGKYREAIRAFEIVLQQQPTNYAALWGKAVALEDRAEADSLFRAALAERTGIAALRCDYAEYLWRAGRRVDAEKHVHEAELIRADDANVLVMRGLLAAAEQPDSALGFYERALARPESPRLAAVRKAALLHQRGRNAEARELANRLQTEAVSRSPEWAYDTEFQTYVVARAWDHKARAELAACLAKL